MSGPKLSDVSSRYGAPMGRPANGSPLPNELCGLHRIPLDSGGYDSGGAYWGWPNNLYRLTFAEGQAFTRAASRTEAFHDFRERFRDDFRVRGLK